VWDVGFVSSDRIATPLFGGTRQALRPLSVRGYGPGVVKLAGAASSAVRDLLAGPARSGRLVAAFPRCAYVDVGGRLVALEAADGLHLPCAVTLAVASRQRPLAGLAPGDEVTVGDRRLVVGDLVVEIGRWWAPSRPRDATGSVPDAAGVPVPAPGWDRLVLGLLGLGPGLTPAGDDLLAGLLVGLSARPDLRDPLAAAITRHAAARTTWLSAELLRLAAAGLAARAVVAVADALAGHGDDEALPRTLPSLLAVGHTSGPALARGLLLAAATTARSHAVAA
jgi:hypothetical protein